MPTSSLAILDALPSYLGGKRSLAPKIFAAINQAGYTPGQGHVLVDAFMGGGSVSLLGKALGFRVIANDISPRSEAIGRALLENTSVHLSREDVAAALAFGPGDRYHPSPKRLPFTEDVRDLLISMVRYADEFDSPARRALMRTLVMKATVRVAMWGQLKSEGNKRIAERRYDRLTAGQATWLKTASRPRKQILNEARLLDKGIFTNGLKNEMHLGDVLGFLDGVQGDVAYFDPPYPGTVAYEDEYVGVDELLLGQEIQPEKSRFSARDGWKFLADVFDAAEHIPTWVLSLGNEAATLEQLTELMSERGREVQATSLQYVHLLSQASAEKTASNEEFILVAKKAAVPAGAA